jgi:hypothetical protein
MKSPFPAVYLPDPRRTYIRKAQHPVEVFLFMRRSK